MAGSASPYWPDCGCVGRAGRWGERWQCGLFLAAYEPLFSVVVLLLASASPARRRLLEQAAIPHRVRVSGVDESTIYDRDPRTLVQQLAFAKASAVQSCLKPSVDAEITAVLGCDSVFVFEGEVFGKPVDAKEAINRWQRMAGHSGELLTGHCLITDCLLYTSPSPRDRG